MDEHPSGQLLPSDTIDRAFETDRQPTSRAEHFSNEKIELFDIPYIDKFKNSDKPLVSDEKRMKIKEKLDLEHISNEKTKEREKIDQYYLHYTNNPFLQLDLVIPKKKPGSKELAEEAEFLDERSK